MKMIKFLSPIFLLIALSYWSVTGVLSTDFFPIHDNTQVQRVFEMSKSLSDGMLPVRWVADLGYGYGYPIFNFYAPLSYYFGAILSLAGFDVLFATKLMMAVGILIAGISMYALGKTLWGEVGGIVSALFYVYAPYHALNIFVRGAVGEFWAYGFIPLIFYSLIKIIDKNNWKYVFIGAFSYAGVILSHNLTAFMLTPFLVLFAVIFSLVNRKFIYYFLLIIVIGLGLSSFYILPAVFESKYTNVLSIVGGGADFRDHFVCIPQLWDSLWGFGGSTSGCIDGMSFRLGKLHIMTTIGAFVLLLFGLFFKKIKIKDSIKKNIVKLAFAICSLVGLIFSIFMMLDISKPIWEVVPYIEFMQYPWRFLIFTSFFMSISSGIFIWRLELILKPKKLKKLIIPSALLLIFILIYINGKLFIPQFSINVSDKDLISKDSLSWTTSKISDEYMPQGFNKPLNKNEIPFGKIPTNQNVEVLYEESTTSEVHASIRVLKDTQVRINIAYFPTWIGYLDNTKIELRKENNGVGIEVPEGIHSLDLFFEETPIQKLGNSLSLAFLFIVVVGIIFSMKRSGNEG